MKKFLKAFLALGLTAALLSTSVYGADVSSAASPEDDYEDGGAMCMNLLTGEETYLPPPETSTYSNAVEGFVKGYDPFDGADDSSLDDDLQTYMNNNRVTVDDPTSNLYSRCIVHLTIKMSDNRTAYGSGFLIRSNVVVTAGHVVFDKEYSESGWASSITVTPSARPTGVTAPYGTAQSTTLICGLEWAKNFDYDYDWGVIILDSNIGDQTGWFGLYYQSNSYNGTKVRVNGYDKYRYQYTVSGTITTSKSRTIESTNIYVDEGMSGGPCYIYSSEYGYVAIGIISRYDSYDEGGWYHSDSYFRRINKTLYENLLSYCEEYAL